MKFKYIYFFIISNLLLGINFVLAWVQNTTRDAIIWNDNTLWLSTWWTWWLNQVFDRLTWFIFSILWIVWVGVFLYFGYKLLMARWNQEEMKKVLMGFAYAVIWLAIIPMAYVLVSLISSLNI